MNDSAKRTYKTLGYILTFGSLFFGIGYIFKNIEKVKFHLFNDTSMCFCGPDITQAGTKGDLLLLSLVMITGIVILIKQK